MTDSCNDSEDELPLSTVVKRKHNLVGNDTIPSQKSSCEVTKKLCSDDTDETSRSSITFECVLAEDEEAESFQASRLFEYQWPADEKGAEFYLLQEQVTEFLQCRAFQRRFPSIERRPVDMTEREMLRERGVVTEVQCTLGLTAVKSEDVCEIMMEEFPDKYQQYIKMAHEREIQNIIKEQEAQRAAVTMGKVPFFMKRALKQTAQYNALLNLERREERSAYFDLQTQIIHYPQPQRKYIPLSRKRGGFEYPVALMPGQWQDGYKSYTPAELNHLPLRTVVTPMREETEDNTEAEEEQEEAEEKEEATVAAVEKGEETVEDSGAMAAMEEMMAAQEALASAGPNEPPPKDPFCGICMKGPEMNKRGVPEKLIHCSKCVNSGHPSCLDMPAQMVKVIATYDWFCMECKVCVECLAPHDEDEMMFCDNCDRGYHSYCIGLKDIPKGRWVCNKCGKCSSCLATEPSAEQALARWKNEMTRPRDEAEPPAFLQIHCHPCSKLFRKGEFCPACLKVYRHEDDAVNPMVCCDECDRWIHKDCDGIDDQRYQELSKDCKSSYSCLLCRGEREERMDSFHKKNR